MEEEGPFAHYGFFGDEFDSAQDLMNQPTFHEDFYHDHAHDSPLNESYLTQNPSFEWRSKHDPKAQQHHEATDGIGPSSSTPDFRSSLSSLPESTQSCGASNMSPSESPLKSDFSNSLERDEMNLEVQESKLNKRKREVVVSRADQLDPGPSDLGFIEDSDFGIDCEGIDRVNRLRKPMNAYLLFCKDYREQFKDQHQYQNTTELAALMGRMWKMMPDDVRQYYKAKARELYRKFMQEHPLHHLRRMERGMQMRKMMSTWKGVFPANPSSS